MLACMPFLAFSMVRGIYITQSTAQNASKMNYFTREAKRLGIDTFVIDLSYRNSRYDRNVKKLVANGINYVVRIVVFPNGGSYAQVSNQNIWKKRMKLIDHAISLGVKEIQLDYIRYHTKVRTSSQNARNIKRVIAWFEEKIADRAALQIDVFGETSFKPSPTVGQDVKLFAEHIDVLNPMVYPSHYYPSDYHSKRPYQTVYKSLVSVKEQFNHKLPFRLNPFIEVNNHLYRMPFNKKVKYIQEQIRAVHDSGADGWYAWSPRNKYKALFRAIAK